MRIAIIGANGQLGSDVTSVLKENGYDVSELTHNEIEISNIDCVDVVLKDIKPDVVVNTAAFHNVPRCEEEPEKAFLVNGVGTMNLARISNDIDATLIHISTDYVFDGEKKSPYVEIDPPAPLNVYGNTKLSGEYFIRAIANKYYILRVSGLYGENPCRAKGGYNFVELMLKKAKEQDEVRVVNDEFLTPTFTKEVARQISKMLKKMPGYGLYHATAEGSCSWYEFAQAIFEITDTEVNLKEAAPGEFASGVKRPKYSVLENYNLKKAGINIFKHWKESLEEYIKTR